ncbi:SRPBCC domain-containing protein [Shimia abyssi]|uniref:Uncharacterized protein YndB with AHSA1/START domain n=1 Tax=Shimia abyssi TaxID=1662395 RepID=A0A2P8FAY2_9RHOB|nr:SRPBCC domain-containing protein [Shimia abyssi]PSL18859.1 uncharacterized protein YndB with AHSA1/START domain [Shimia abyssi]
MTDAIVKTVQVDVSPERAFDVFTSQIAMWWPGAKHSVSAGKGEVPLEIGLEPRKGGAIYEILQDGSRLSWGEILEWQPPYGFEMTWHPGQDAALATRLALAFEAADDGCTVTLTHSGWEVLAERAAAMSEHYASGWDHVLGDCFCGAFAQ